MGDESGLPSGCCPVSITPLARFVASSRECTAPHFTVAGLAHDPIGIDPSAAPERFLYVLPDLRRCPPVS